MFKCCVCEFFFMYDVKIFEKVKKKYEKRSFIQLMYLIILMKNINKIQINYSFFEFIICVTISSFESLFRIDVIINRCLT